MVRVALDHEPTAAVLTALVEAAPAYKVTNPWWMQPVAQWLRTGVLPTMDPPIPQLVLAPSLARLQRETVPAFGRAMRERWFQLDPDTAFLNHGCVGDAAVGDDTRLASHAEAETCGYCLLLLQVLR